jgi:NADH-quinone oxidoreductase subunit J
VLPTVVIGLSLGVIFLKQPVHNLLCLITVFFSAASLYLYAGAEFLAFLFLIVYVGAIAILFLFVIMLLHLKPVFAGALMIISGFA